MNTTTDTAAPFIANAVYSVPSLSIHYDIEMSEGDKMARIKDGEFIFFTNIFIIS